MAGIGSFIKSINPFKGKEVAKIKAAFTGYTNGAYRALFAFRFDGEKNLGEIGPIKSYVLDYEALRLRAWQSYLESEITQTIVNKFITWTIGKGLKLQAEPDTNVLESEGYPLSDPEKFSNLVESRFAVYAKSTYCDYSGMNNLHHISRKVLLNAQVGGDVLVLLRYYNGTINVQLIDATHVVSPLGYGTEWFPKYLENGNRITNGIEIDPDGKHIAFHVRKPGLTFETQRIPARSKTGLQTAFLVYGMEYRIDNVRGIPIVSTVLESLKKLERYKEATLGSAEERQKIVLQVVHQLNAIGESPFTKQLAKAHDFDAPGNDNLPADINGRELANTVAATTNKSTYNMAPGSELKALESKNELYFKEFYDTHYDVICSCLGMPPDVARSKYDSNFSASRAALKDWEHSLNVNRDNFKNQFLGKVYSLWLHVEILNNKIPAPGYIEAFLKKNWMVIDAYCNARFVGAAVPHIDPLKEVQAERAKLGDTGLSIPLTTVEQATEALNGGNSDANIDQYGEELKKTKSLGIELPLPLPPQSGPPKS